MRWLLLRGLAREARHWGDFAETFGRGVGAEGTATVDLPGYGTELNRPVPLTVRAMTNDVRRRFGPVHAEASEPWGIFGVSLGGMVALDWMDRFPGDFARGVVVNTSAATASWPWQRLRLRQLARVVRAYSAPPVERERQLLAIVSSCADAGRTAETAEQWAALDPGTRTAAVRQLLAGATALLPRTLAPPTLVLVSGGDALVNPACSETIAARLKLPLRRHPTAGHDLPLDDGPWVAQQVSRWLAESPASG
jgi:pimeloyl-ACP methyl ester carboxylesterase